MAIFSTKFFSDEAPWTKYGWSYQICWLAVGCMLVGSLFTIYIACESRRPVDPSTMQVTTDGGGYDNNVVQLALSLGVPLEIVLDSTLKVSSLEAPVKNLKDEERKN